MIKVIDFKPVDDIEFYNEQEIARQNIKNIFGG